MVPPLIRCLGIRAPAAKALNGVYEFQGVVEGRPCYRQTGISSGNHLWFSEEAEEGPMWVVTLRDKRVGGAPDHAIGRCPGIARWPWEAEGWEVCGKAGRFAAAPAMRFQLLLPAAELVVETHLPLLPRPAAEAEAGPGGGPPLTFRAAGEINGRPAFRQPGAGGLNLFWMPKMSRWLLAVVRAGGGGVQCVAARSQPDDGSSWSSLWPWEARAWELPTAMTHGLIDGDATWEPADGRVLIRLASPAVTIAGDPATVPRSLVGLYEPQGMVHGRAYYVQRLEDISLENSVGPKCLWFAEDRGQWVLTDPVGLGVSRVVLARIASRAWWPWEAHLSGTTSPASLGAAPFAALPVWKGGKEVMAASRVGWEVADPAGTFHKARDMAVSLVGHECCEVKAHEMAMHAFLGVYDHQGLVSSRPFFLQRLEASGALAAGAGGEALPEEEAGGEGSAGELPPGLAVQRFAIWYAEELDQWVITEDFRLLDCITVDARAADSAWSPWGVACNWEISDRAGGFCKEPNMRVEAVPS